MTWKEKTRLCLATFTRSMTGTGSMWSFLSYNYADRQCLFSILFYLFRAVEMLSAWAVIISTNNHCSFSFFLGELEKCLDEPDHLGTLFVKHVSSFLHVVFRYSLFPSLHLYYVCSCCRSGGCTCTLFTARTNPSLSTSSQSTLTLTLRYMLHKTVTKM